MRISSGIVFFFWVCLLAGPACGQALEREFLGIPWGADIKDQRGYALLYAKGALGYYIQPDTVRTVKGFQIDRVIYGTHDDHFFSAFLLIDSMETFDAIKTYMESRYGFPKITWSVAGDQTIYKWRYKTIRVKLKFYQKDRRMKLAFYYTPIADKVNEKEAETHQQKSLQFLPIERDKQPEAMPLLVF